jgi:hypothetical protein
LPSYQRRSTALRKLLAGDDIIVAPGCFNAMGARIIERTGRRPEAVVRSMLFHWRRGALNRLFRACGRHALDEKGAKRFERFGTHGFRRAEMACLSYNVKTAQIHEIAAELGRERLYILDYDDLINRSDSLLPDIFSFLSVSYDERFLNRLRKQNRR